MRYHRTPPGTPAMTDTLRTLFERRLRDPRTSWNVGCFGAIAEFHWDADEDAWPVEPLGRATARGSIRIEDPDTLADVGGLAWEGAGGHGTSWTQGFVAHMPAADARMSFRTELTRLPDEEGAAGGALFDIGLGAPNVDACVLVDDPELVAVLEAGVGRSIWDDENPAMPAIKEASPTRVFRSRLAEVRVHQHIGRHAGRPTPTGPHTHVIRGLLKSVLPQAANIPVPDGRVAVLGMFPPHPLRDELGEPKAFARAEWDAFQELLSAWGPPGHVARKAELLEVARGSTLPSGRSDRQVERIVLPQLVHLGVSSERLDELAAAWRLEHVVRAMDSPSPAPGH